MIQNEYMLMPKKHTTQNHWPSNITKLYIFVIIAGGMFLFTDIFTHLSFIRNVFYVVGVLCIITLLVLSRIDEDNSFKLIIKIFIYLFTICSFCVILLFFSLKYSPMIGSRVAENVTKEKILSLKLGMNKEEIIKILGNPIKTDYNNGNWLIYATPGIHGLGFEINIGISNNKLSCIHIEKNDFWIYVCCQNECPGIVNKSAFEELFFTAR